MTSYTLTYTLTEQLAVELLERERYDLTLGDRAHTQLEPLALGAPFRLIGRGCRGEGEQSHRRRRTSCETRATTNEGAQPGPRRGEQGGEGVAGAPTRR